MLSEMHISPPQIYTLKGFYSLMCILYYLSNAPFIYAESKEIRLIQAAIFRSMTTRSLASGSGCARSTVRENPARWWAAAAS